jgi:hypothetical protein
MRLNSLEQTREAHAARIADQGDAVAALRQFLRERRGGDHVTPGAAGGEDEMLGARHEALQFFT